MLQSNDDVVICKPFIEQRKEEVVGFVSVSLRKPELVKTEVVVDNF